MISLLFFTIFFICPVCVPDPFLFFHLIFFLSDITNDNIPLRDELIPGGGTEMAWTSQIGSVCYARPGCVYVASASSCVYIWGHLHYLGQILDRKMRYVIWGRRTVASRLASCVACSLNTATERWNICYNLRAVPRLKLYRCSTWGKISGRLREVNISWLSLSNTIFINRLWCWWRDWTICGLMCAFVRRSYFGRKDMRWKTRRWLEAACLRAHLPPFSVERQRFWTAWSRVLALTKHSGCDREHRPSMIWRRTF